MKQRMRDVWRSFRALPAWVQWWVAAVLVLDTVDAWRWLCGQRDVAGSSNLGESTETCA